MSEKIVFLRPGKMGAVPLLHQVAERDGLDAVVICARIDGRWHTAWGGEDLNCASLSMATLSLTRDVTNYITEDEED